MPFVSPIRIAHRTRGVALVIVLAFVVLLTGLILAFFSRAISERLISNSSAGQVRVDLFTQGAADTIIGDLKQEIAAGSNIVTVAPNATVYAPKVATAMPALVLGTATNTGGLNNLVKRSARNQPFFPANGNYDITNYPPATRAAAVFSDAASLNGRYISADRWNKPLLLAKKDLTIEAVTPTADFVSPDWVLVARDGSNPTTWDKNMAISNSAPTSVVGRYAYNIYDEGGLLDANVAGYPVGNDSANNNAIPYPSSGLATLPVTPTRKGNLAYADLTIPVPQYLLKPGDPIDPLKPTLPLLTAAQVNALVGWRNYASAQPGGSFPSFTPAPTPADPPLSPFDLATLMGSSGNLSIAKTSLFNKQSDRMFGGRQELMKLLLQGVATDSTARLPLQNALQYLGTFSRGLEQPSVIRTQSVDTAALGYGTNPPPQVMDPSAGGTNAVGLDRVINPSFLAVRVKTAGARLRVDSSDLVVGEPLVKKRFPLSRIAWLTYVGPITLDGTSYNSKLDPIYVSTLKQTYGLTDAFLLRGTPSNIQLAFGLNWSNNAWSYSGHNRGGSTGPICKLDAPADIKDVVRSTPAREADFFELLKASISVGSLAKAATTSTPTILPGGSAGSYQSQYTDDSSVDGAIIQIGANIIDQFDLDGYPTWIQFNDGGSAVGRNFYGTENLPYLSRLTHALVKVKQADPTVDPATTFAKNTGVGALLQCPELWNPHDYQTSNLNQTAGVVGPTKFRIYATSGNTAGVNSAVRVLGILRTGTGTGHNHQQATVLKSPGYQSQYGFQFAAPETRVLSQANTELDFDVPKDPAGAMRFREPTILFQTSSAGGYVTGSPAIGGFGTIGGNAGFFSGKAFRSDVGTALQGAPPAAGSGYVGFYLGAVPLYWADVAPSSTYFWLDNVASISLVDIHYYLQYQDAATGNWVTYDEKYRTFGGGNPYSENSTLCSGGDKSTSAYGWSSFFYPRVSIPSAPAGDPRLPNGQWDTCYGVMDPRSSRFHLMKFTAGNARYWAYPPYSAQYGTPLNDPATIATRTAAAGVAGFTYGWVDASKGITLPLRNGINDGASLYCPVGLFPTTMGWNPGSDAAGAPQSFVTYTNTTLGTVTGLHICRPGMFSQNNPYARRNDRPMGDTGDPLAMDNTFAAGGQSNAAQSYRDADGVIRRAMGGLVPYSNSAGGPPATSDVGLPMTTANTSGTTRLSQSDSRPVILNRPFRTVGELAYTFSGTPWKNLNFTMPESGDTALLDVFCASDTEDPSGLVAGKVNLNTRQAPVLQAVIAGAYKDEWNPGTSTIGAALPASAASALVARTTSIAAGKGPLQNVSELVGKFVSRIDANADSNASDPTGTAISGIATVNKGTTISPKSYDGFSADLINNTVYPPKGVLLNDPNITIPRFANATLRALAASGQTRVWNLMIDVIAQTGRYPQSAASADKFSVEGEQRYWVHVAIDRLTGQVLDKQIEVVKE